MLCLMCLHDFLFLKKDYIYTLKRNQSMVFILNLEEALFVLAVRLGTKHITLNCDHTTHTRDLLFICDGLVAAVTDSHFKFEAHQRDGGALGAALTTDSLPTLAAMVLERERESRHVF